MSTRDTLYDPEMRNTPLGKKLYGAWKRAHAGVHTKEFERFPDFLAWAMKNGGEYLSSKMFKKDLTAPYSPQNCYWKVYQTEEEPESIYDWDPDAWDQLTARLRLLWGYDLYVKEKEHGNK